MKKQFVYSLLLFLGLVGTGVIYRTVIASDHDDGENDLKARALNLTDHFVFREGDADGNSADNSNLILIQNSNPRSLPQQQYFFSTTARYEFHLSRVTNSAATPTGSEDMQFYFNFGSPDSNNNQSVLFTVMSNGAVVGTATGTTSNLTNSSSGSPTTNTVSVGGQTYTFFAGLREDPFFFDVERFFQIRSFALGTFVLGTSPTLPNDCSGHALNFGGNSSSPGTLGSFALFNPASCAPDFTKGYNVNSIVLRAPIAALQSNSETTFDTWSIISYQQ